MIGLLWFSIDKLGSLPNTFVAACNLRAASTCSGVKAGGGVCTGGGGGGGVATGLSDSFTAVSAFSSTACLSSSVTITGGGGGAGSVLGSARAGVSGSVLGSARAGVSFLARGFSRATLASAGASTISCAGFTDSVGFTVAGKSGLTVTVAVPSWLMLIVKASCRFRVCKLIRCSL